MEYTDFIKKINSMKFVAHRMGYKMTKYPENSIESLKEIFKNKRVLDLLCGFEFDICFTKDNIPVVIHDTYIDDITNYSGRVKSYTYQELSNMNIRFRKSRNAVVKDTFKISTLEEILSFFNENSTLLGNKKLRIETKNIFFLSKKKANILIKIFDKYPLLSKNIIHISYYPLNLIILKSISQRKRINDIKNDLLCDYKPLLYLTKFIKSIDAVSIRIRTKDFPNKNKQNTKKVNRKILFDSFTMKFSNALSNKSIEYAIRKNNEVNIYVLNDKCDVEEFCRHISAETFNKYYNKMIFTSDNPINIKKLFND